MAERNGGEFLNETDANVDALLFWTRFVRKYWLTRKFIIIYLFCVTVVWKLVSVIYENVFLL